MEPRTAVSRKGFDKRIEMRYIYATAMKQTIADSTQSMQRVRVGMTGLASVLVLIGLASAVFSSASREGPVVADGASNAQVVANMTDGMAVNSASAPKDNEPLAELGIAPSSDPAKDVAPSSHSATR